MSNNLVGWGRTSAEPGFGATYDSTSVKAKTINLIASVRTVMRSKFYLPASHRHEIRLFGLHITRKAWRVFEVEGGSTCSSPSTPANAQTYCSTPYYHQHSRYRLRACSRLILHKPSFPAEWTYAPGRAGMGLLSAL
jgi:Yos1-like.